MSMSFIMAVSLFSVLHEEHLPADHHPHGDVRSLAELQGFYFSSEGGDKGTPLFALHPPLVSSQVWAATFCQLAPRLLPSHPSINDLTYSKTNNGNFSLVFQSKHARLAVSAAPRPNQHQMSLNCFFLFHHPSFLSGIPHSERTGIWRDRELDQIFKTCYIVRVWNETCISDVRCFIYTCMHAQTFKHAITYACIYKRVSMQLHMHAYAKLLKLIHFKYTIQYSAYKRILAPGAGHIKHLVPPCISAMQLFEAEHVSIRADSMHQLLPKRQQIAH